MKKILFALGIIPITISSQASAQSVSAVNIKGECQTFISQSQVPSQSKIVPSCNLIKNEDFGQSIQEKMRERLNKLFAKKRALKKQEEATDRKSTARPNKFIGRGGLTKTGEYTKRNQKNREENKRSVRTSTQKNYSQAARNRHKELNPQIGGLEHKGDTTSAERKARRSYRPALQSATRMDREGYLSNSVKYSELLKERDKKQNIGAQRYWKSYKQMSKKKEEHKPEEIKLKRLWKGERLEGELSR